ncbi:Retrovirus-related Pol polyprotein from transposon RE2 [Senna tora]|uniref:Retrovirus-related Pol polyprotein from transposon RE2 n=1 Tax=Senna tora TaxID=362788 RepID=A0A834U1W1_9FABA|nr:Retrovirus-related Pol polyprotein from transposon RE2 [Senna tora]
MVKEKKTICQTLSKPKSDDPTFKKWKAENQMVMTWLINSMTLEIGEDFMFFDTAAEIWNAAKESYSDVENTAELFEIKEALHDLKQGRILSIKPLPSIREVLSTVRHEASRSKLMLGSSVNSNSVEESALAAHGVSRNLGNGQKKGRPWCDHCRRPGHLKDKCSSNIVATGSSAEKGNFSNALLVTSNPSNFWIVDSRASDHMSGHSGVFSSWYPYTKNYKVRIADGSLSDITGTGEDSNGKAEFSHSSCSFQDVDSGKVIGNARVHDGLYRVEMNRESTSNKQSFATGLEKGSFKEDRDIMVLHFSTRELEYQFYDPEPSPTPEIPDSKKELVYSRRKKESQAGGDEDKNQEGVDETRDEVEDPMYCQDAPLDSHPPERGNTAPNLAISDECSNDALSPPIAKRKGISNICL